MQVPLTIRRRIRKESARINRMERKLKNLSERRQKLEGFLPFDFVGSEKANLDKNIASGVKGLETRRQGFDSIRKTFDVQDADYARSKSKHGNEGWQKTPHQVELDSLLERHSGNPVLAKKLSDFAKSVEIKPVSVGLKKKHHEGDFDVGVYFGGRLQGWFGLEHNKKFNALTIESVQGAKGVPGVILKSEAIDSWYKLLSNRVVDSLINNGESRVALINWDYQKSAQHKPESKALYNSVARALKKRAKKVIKVEGGKYFLYYLGID